MTETVTDFLDHPVAQIFLQARYRDAVEATYEQENWSHEDPTAAITIAALSFVGRLDEAKSVLRLAKQSPTFGLDQRIFASFYLATSLTRHGHYGEARKLLSEIFWLQRKRNNRSAQKFKHRNQFFIVQGLAFFRFVGGRYTDADRHAKNAIEQAILAKFSYGRVLALDLQGHCLHQLGMHRESLQILDDATRLAQKLGLSSLADNITLQRDLFTARFSLDLTPSRKRLEDLMQQVRFQNSYSQSILILELARIALLQGRVTQAKSLLNDSSQLNHVRDDRRMRAQQNLRLALAADMSGNQEEAVTLIKNVLESLDPQMDSILGLQATGLLAQIEAPIESCPLVAQRSGRYLAKRIMMRTHPEQSQARHNFHSEAGNRLDLLGNTLDAIAKKDITAFKQLCAAGSPGLAVRIFGFPRNSKKFIAVFQSSHEFLIADHGDIVFRSTPLTELMIEVLTTIASGNGSLEALATRVWQARDYHPLKHDPKIYRVLSKLRGVLEDGESWIKTSPSGYHLSEDVAILMIDHSGAVRTLTTEYAVNSCSNLQAEQVSDRIYGYVKETGRISNRDVVAKFNISPVTCARALAKLVEQKQLKRMGAGRSTTYVCS